MADAPYQENLGVILGAEHGEAMRNQYGGECYRCGEWCGPGEGHFEKRGRSWLVQHIDCAIVYRGTDVGRNGNPKGERAYGLLPKHRPDAG